MSTITFQLIKNKAFPFNERRGKTTQRTNIQTYRVTSLKNPVEITRKSGELDTLQLLNGIGGVWDSDQRPLLKGRTPKSKTLWFDTAGMLEVGSNEKDKLRFVREHTDIKGGPNSTGFDLYIELDPAKDLRNEKKLIQEKTSTTQKINNLKKVDLFGLASLLGIGGSKDKDYLTNEIMYVLEKEGYERIQSELNNDTMRYRGLIEVLEDGKLLSMTPDGVVKYKNNAHHNTAFKDLTKISTSSTDWKFDLAIRLKDDSMLFDKLKAVFDEIS